VSNLTAMTRQIMIELSERISTLARMPLLEGCPPNEIEQIALRAHVLKFEDGDVIVPEGEEGLGFYFIIDGSARVMRDGAEVARLSGGDYFGEISLLEGAPRNATVVAIGTATCMGILRSFFRPLLARNPRLALKILDEELRRTERLEDVEG
jgi:CRP/FNR family transcriptional regulator, cyclic AMP receptor protein